VTFVDRRDGKPIKPMAVYAANGHNFKPKDLKPKPGPALATKNQAAPLISDVLRHDGAG